MPLFKITENQEALVYLFWYFYSNVEKYYCVITRMIFFHLQEIFIRTIIVCGRLKPPTRV